MPYASAEKKRAYMIEYLGRPGVREARKAYWAAWAEKNREHLRAREHRRKIEKRAQCLVSYARKRARSKGLSFDLDLHTDELQGRIDAGRCELTGLPFSLDGGRTWDSPSIDRIDPSGGYVLSNVKLICFGLNQAFGDWGEDTLLRMVDAMRSCRRSRRHSSRNT